MVSAIPTDPEDFAGSLPSGLSTERALESIPDLVIILDEEGRYFWFNGSYQEILKKLGKTADEVRGRVPWDVLPGLTGTPFQIETERAVRKREYVQYTEHYEPLDTWFEVRIFPFSGGVLVWGRDVTDSIRTNRALSASETRARAVFEQAAVGMARVSTTGRWIEVNERFAAMLGYTQQELVSKTFADVTHPDERMRDLDAARRIVAGELDTYTVDKRYVRKDGSIMWARLTTTLVTEPEGEQVFLSVIEDISHRREVEDALQREERRYRALVDASAKMVWHTSAEGLFVERQPGWEAYTGQKFEEYRGTGWLDAIHPDDRESTGRRWMNAVAERATLEMEYRIRDREGVYRWFLVRAVPILDAEGRIGEWVGTETEIENYVRRRLGDRLLAHLGSLLAAGLEDVDAGLQEAARLIVGTKADRNVADGCMITLLDEGNARQVAIVSADPEIEARARDFFSRYPLADDAPNGYPAVLRTGKSELVQPHEMEAAVIPALSGTSDMLEAQRRLLVYSGLCVPLVARGRINGAMTWVLHGPDRRAAFDERTVELAEEIGRRLALAIENSRLTAAMRASNQELREVNERLQMQAVEMEAQAEELQVTAEELEERTEAADEMRREAEMARQQLVEVFTQAPVAVAVLDRRDLRLSLVNSRFSALFGDAAAVGRTLSESVHGGDNEVLVEGVSQVIETGRSWQLSEWRMAKGESEQIVDFTVEPLRSAAGRVIGAAIVANDVTTQVLAREASEESERLIRTLADAIPTLAWTAQADGFIDWYNARWYEYTGTTPEDMAGWGWQSVHDPEVLPEVLERWKASIATGAPFEMTFPLRGADGVFRQFLTRVSPLTDSEGSVIRWFGTNTDVEIERAALAAAERAVARTERLQLLTAELAGARTASDVARVMVAEAGRAIGASAGLLLLREDGTAALLHSTGLPPDVAGHYAELAVSLRTPSAECLNSGTPVFVDGRSPDELRIRYPDFVRLWSSAVPSAVASLPLAVASELIGVATFTFASPRDFTPEDREFMLTLGRLTAQALERARLFEAEREARAVAEEANKAKMEFLATMSHELRTPLNAIAGYADLLDMRIHGPLTSEQSDTIARLRRSQRHLLGLINDVLNFAKLEAGQVEYDIEDVLVRDALEALDPLIAPQMRMKNQEFDREICDDSLAVRADKDKLRQILVNLMSNAIKFTPDGGKIEIHCDMHPSGAVGIAVSDNGIGIARDRQEQVFAPFVQIDRRLNEPQEGTGLGLAISRDLARAMGGDITVESERGKGSIFTLTLPRSD